MSFFTNFSILFMAFVCTAACTTLIIGYARKKGLVEENNERKTHREKVSSLGGVGIFSGFLLTIAIILQPEIDSPSMVFALGIPLFLVGLFDDMLHAGVVTRLVMQAVLAAFLFDMGFQFVLIEDAWLLNMGATIALVVIFVNAYNFIDGINGLAGGIGASSGLILGAMLAEKGESEMALACFAYTGSLLGFLVFNLSKKAKIFMGDNGSTVLGFYMACIVLATLKGEPVSQAREDLWPVLFCLVSVPVVDAFKVSIFRILRGESPFEADRSHIHHLLTDGALSHPAASTLLIAWTALSTTLTFYLPAAFKWQFALASIAVPYLVAAGISQIKILKPGASSLPGEDMPALRKLQAN